MIIENVNISLTYVYFFYGLAFFSMGLAIILEGDRSSDERLRLSLRPLAAFGILHGIHDWMDMFENMGMIGDYENVAFLWFGIKIYSLSFSFLSLSGFGFSLIAPNMRIRRLSLLAPLLQVTIWGFGIFILMENYTIAPGNCQVACAWTRYSLGIPSALAAAVGLIAQQRTFRRAGMERFGRDSLTASIAFAWYGLVGQLFITPSRLPPSTFLNENLFLYWFHFPIQVFRGALAIIIAVSVIRFMRSFDTEIKRQISDLHALRLREARQREALRGGLIKRIVSAQEAERQRIARELHDDTGQTLTAIGLGLRGISSNLKSNKKKVAANLRKIEIISANALNELQRIISNLRPAHLDDLGLPAAIRWYLNDTKNHTDLNITFQVEGEEKDLPDSVKIAVYRIIQEATTNTIKHAQASEQKITLCYENEKIELWIDDNGIGMDLSQIEQNKRQSWGLLGMRERSELLNGTFNIDSEPGKGVLLNFSIPYFQREQEFYEADEVTDEDPVING